LAKLSEEENFNLKNRYRHENLTLNYADKKRMAIDDSKVVDLLRNQGAFKQKIVKELPTYFN
jgi:SPX domain protein involved in polyphosphate accumulation